jgi:hypothetical protein
MCEIDVHLAKLGGRTNVNERHLFAAATKIGKRRGRDRGNHGILLRERVEMTASSRTGK